MAGTFDLSRRCVPKRAGLHLIIDSRGLSIVGEGEGATAQHERRGRRGWKKRHLGVDPTGVIVAHALTEATLDDATTGQERAALNKLTVSMIPLPIGVALRHGGCRWAMA